MEDQYALWKAAVSTGKPMRIRKDEVPSGRYRYGDDALAVWRDGEGIVYKRGRRGKAQRIGEGQRFSTEAEFAETVFGYFVKGPISDTTYRNWLETGDWPDDPPSLPTDNLPLDPYERAKALLEIEVELFEEWSKTVDHSLRETSDKAARWAQRIGGLADDAEAARVAEKKPHDEASKAVQAKWKPIVDRASAYVRKAKDVAAVFLKAEQARLDAEHKERLLREREEAAKRDVAADPVMSEAPAAAPKAQAGGKGSVVSLVTTRKGVVEDAAALCTFLVSSKNPDLLACLQLIADRAARAKIAMPGVKIEEIRTAR